MTSKPRQKMDADQVQGIWGAGYAKGFIDAIDELRREGWRTVRNGDELAPGDICRMITSTVFDYKGRVRVVCVDGDSVEAERIEDRSENERLNMVDCMAWDLAKRFFIGL
jgi:hypothetical protein